jgi:hypothetical protein
MKQKISFLILLVLPFSALAYIGANYVGGKITNITSIDDGLLVRIGENEVPENCTSGRVWMKIDQGKTAMIAMTLSAWTLGREVVVYTSPATSGYCQVSQVDPRES